MYLEHISLRYFILFFFCTNRCILKHIEIIAVTVFCTTSVKQCNIDVYLGHLPQTEFFKSIVSSLKIVM